MEIVRRNMADWITGLLLLAMVYVLAKPESAGAEFITAFTGAMAALVKTATGVGEGEGDEWSTKSAIG